MVAGGGGHLLQDVPVPLAVNLHYYPGETILKRVYLHEEYFQQFGVFRQAGVWHTASIL